MNIISEAGSVVLLNWLLKDAGDDLIIRLYRNNYTPLSSSVIGSFTEANFTSYDEIAITRASWGDAEIVNGKAIITYNTNPSWTNSGASQVLYGYYITDSADNYIWAQRFDTPRTLNTSATISFALKFALQSEY